METSYLDAPRPGGRSRFSKALPAPPALDDPFQDQGQVVRPVRKDSLPSRRTTPPALPPKDSVAASVPSSMATKTMDAPLPALPSLTRVTSPPTVIPRRKPVGSGASVKSAKSPPPPQSLRSGDISPVDSISSLLSAYGTEDSSGRYSVDTAATKHSFAEPSPPKLPPKDFLVTGTGKLDIVSPLSLNTPLSSNFSKMMDQYGVSAPGQYQVSPPTSPTKDNNGRPVSPRSSDNSLDAAVTSPTSVSSQSPSKPQIWRRRSLKSDKPLTVPELKLSVSHGSTASPQQVTSSVNNELPVPPQSSVSINGIEIGEDSRTLENGSEDLSGHDIRPSPLQKPLPRNPTPENMGNKKSKESLDGFSRYAQELEQGRSAAGFKTPQYSPAKMSPELHRPPTPDYGTDEAQTDGTIYSPASPMTPPDDTRLLVQGDDARPLSIIQEHPDNIESTTSAPAPSGSLSRLPVRSSSRPGNGRGSSPPRPGLPLSSGPDGQGQSLHASALAKADSTPLAPAASITVAAPSTTSLHARSTSSISVPTTIAVSDDGDASTVKAANSPRPAPTMTVPQQAKAIFHEQPASPTSPTSARHGDPAYFPMRLYLAQPVAPGTVLSAPAIKPSQLDCFAGHYRFVASRNEEHPLACQTCLVKDNGLRYACAHCAVRVCKDCCDVLMMNGRNVQQLVEMLKS